MSSLITPGMWSGLDNCLRVAGVFGGLTITYALGQVWLALAGWCDSETRGAPKLKGSEYTGKVVWITGGSSGIGRELAYQLARQGAKVIISSRREEALLKVKEAILADPKSQVTADDVKIVVLDLEKLDTLEAAAKQALSYYGYVDVLINNGGISTRGTGRDAELSLDIKLMNVDFMSYVAVTRAVLPSMTKNGGGRIINLSSVAGKLGAPLRTAYCAAKFAVIGWFDALRLEEYVGGTNINVTNVCPGSVKTDVSKNSIHADGSKFGVTDPNIAAGIPVEFACERILAAAHADVDEVWIAKGPEMFALYFSQYFPAKFRRGARKSAKDRMETTHAHLKKKY